MKTVLKIGIDALPNAELARFTALFQVAETRTQVSWVRVRPADADVVVSHRQPWRGSHAVSLCIEPAQAHSGHAHVVALESGFRVLTLIAALDRASALVLESRGVRKACASIASRLRHWEVLRSDKLSANHARVTAAMSRRAVTRDWMAAGGSLSFTEVDDLLSELREHGPLHGSGAEPLVWQPAKPQPAAQLSRPGLLSRLRGWFSSDSAGPAQSGKA